MNDHSRMPHRFYYADFEVREIALGMLVIGVIIGTCTGVLIGWWTA